MSNTTKFWSSKPFVSYDGEDESGVRAEVEVVLGYGTIRKIDRKEKTAKIEFQAAHDKYFPQGWLPFGQEAFEMVEKAEESNTPIYFRIEKLRKKGVDRTLPISTWKTMEENKENTNRSVAAVRFEETDEWTFNKYAVTNPKEDPNSNTARPSALNMSDNDLSKNKVVANNYQGFEPAPYITKLKNGNVNPGSIAVSVPLNLLSFVAEWDRNHEGDVHSQVGEKKRIVVARILLSAANELQKEIYDGELEAPDLSAGSHTRARALLFEVIRSYYPLSSSIVESKENLKEWRDELVEKSLAMWKWSISEVESFMK